MKINNPNYLNGLNSSASEIDGSVNRDKQTIVIIGDSLIAQDKADANQTSSFGMFAWANALSGNNLVLLNNAGIGGENSTQILARVDADVIAYNPTYCMFTCGMNNDTLPSSTLNLQNDIIAIYKKLNKAGIYSIILTNTPKTSDIQMTKRALRVNEWMQQYFKNLPNCIVIDIFKAVIKSTATDSSVIANSYRDDKHQSNYGAYLEGYEIAKFFKTLNNKIILPSSALDNKLINEYSLNHAKNPLFLGTSGTKDNYSTGDVANYVTINGRVNTSNVCTLSTREDGFGNYQEIVTTVSGSSGAVESTIYLDADKTSLVAGDKFYAILEIVVDKNSTNFASAMLGLEANNSVLKRSFLSNYSPQYPISLKDNQTVLTIKTDIAEIPSDSPFSLRAALKLKLIKDGVTTFKISRFGLFKVVI